MDNRIQRRVGAAAPDLGQIQAPAVLGLPVSISGQSRYFDHQEPGTSK